jgi:hypothetical protein
VKLPVERNSEPAANAEPYAATIWDRLNPASRRNINIIKDRLPKEV